MAETESVLSPLEVSPPNDNAKVSVPKIDPNVTPKSEEIGTLLSRLRSPVIIDYGTTKIRLGARGRTQSDIIRGLLNFPLPAGVLFVVNK
jgi:hypothetical protein